MYPIQKGIPIPETRGRKKGSLDQNSMARQTAISNGVALVASGASYVEAAKAVGNEYSPISVERMARLISQSIRLSKHNELTADLFTT